MLQYCLPPQQVLRVLEDLPWSLAIGDLSPREQEVWQQRSPTERELKRQLVEDEAEHLAAALELARSHSLQEFQDASLTHAASHLRFNHSDWQAVKALAASDSWSHADT